MPSRFDDPQGIAQAVADGRQWLASRLPWRTIYLGSWGRPRDQKMMVFDRI
jgi:hypothetical protein